VLMVENATTQGGEPHAVANDAGLFHSGAFDQNDTFSSAAFTRI
jgi:hypothetical protein